MHGYVSVPVSIHIHITITSVIITTGILNNEYLKFLMM